MKLRSKLLAILLTLVIVVVSFIVVFTVVVPKLDVPRTDWINSYTYRISHNITGSPGAGNDYQIKLTAHYQSGTNQGDNFYLAGKCQSDFSDIYFTDDDGVTPLSYWLETKTDGDSAVFWVKINDNLDTNQLIYIYYGNSLVTSASNIETTFPFADDFSGSTLNTTKWETTGQGKITVNNGTCTISAIWGSGGWVYIRGLTDFGLNYSVMFRSLNYEQAFYRWTHHGWGDGSAFSTGVVTEEGMDKGKIVLNDLPNFITMSQETSNFTWTYRSKADGVLSRLDMSNSAPAPGVYYTGEIQRLGPNDTVFYQNSKLMGSITSNVPTVNMRVMFASDNSGHDQTAVTSLSWVVIRKCISNEPRHGIWGGVEDIKGFI
jgi:hypothetical protein